MIPNPPQFLRNVFPVVKRRVRLYIGISLTTRNQETAIRIVTAGETLTWTYDRAARTATFLHERVNLNCCGERTIAAYPENNRLLINETDAPGSGGRCRCMCNYDFYTEIGGLSSGRVEVVLQITIDGALKKKWTGTINLAAGSGTIAIPKAD